MPLIAALLGLPTEGRYPALDLTPQRQKQLTLAALVEQLEGLAAAQPVLLAYEDVHWSDPTTQELLGLTIERVQRLPVLLLITYRPEFSPPWPAQPHVSALALSRLGRREGAALVERVVRDKPLPDEVAAQIVAKTDGVPLFVEELTKTVLESGLLKDAGDHYELAGPLPPLAIPATLHDSLLARLDRLAPGQGDRADRRRARPRVLPRAARRGRRPARGGAAGGARPAGRGRAGLPPRRAARCHLQLQARAGPGRRLRHAAQITPPAAARAASRRSWRNSSRRSSKPSPNSSRSTTRGAGLTEQAIVYWEKAGERAIQRSANAEAIERLSKALELLETVPETPERIRRELALQTRLGPAVHRRQGLCGARGGDRLHPGARAVRAGRGLPGAVVLDAAWPLGLSHAQSEAR